MAKGLRACPEANATLVPGGLWLYRRILMGVSVPTPDGIAVPVLPDPDLLAVTQIAGALKALARRGTAGLFQPEDVVGSTFGISNTGTLGIIRDIPVVFPPQTATLTCGAVTERPVAVDGRVEIRPVMEASLAFDHRAMDGEGAARFFAAFRGALEQGQFA